MVNPPPGSAQVGSVQPGVQRGPAPTRVSLAAPALSPARSRILEHLQRLGTAVSADELATEFASHSNTVREHLEGLVDSGLVIRERVPGPGRGRPPWRYRADRRHTEPDSRVRTYGALAAALAGQLAATPGSDPGGPRDAASLGRAAGRRWAQTLPAAAAPASGTSTATALTELLTELGFGPRTPRESPELTRESLELTRETLELTRCPLLDAAQAQPDVICAVHEGMISETLASWGEPHADVQLLPFATAEGCLLSWSAGGGR